MLVWTPLQGTNVPRGQCTFQAGLEDLQLHPNLLPIPYVPTMQAVHVLKGAAPAVESADTAFSRNTVAWHPDGGL